MDDENAGARRPGQDLECRPPLQGDVVALCICHAGSFKLTFRRGN